MKYIQNHKSMLKQKSKWLKIKSWGWANLKKKCTSIIPCPLEPHVIHTRYHSQKLSKQVSLSMTETYNDLEWFHAIIHLEDISTDNTSISKSVKLWQKFKAKDRGWLKVKNWRNRGVHRPRNQKEI